MQKEAAIIVLGLNLTFQRVTTFHRTAFENVWLPAICLWLHLQLVLTDFYLLCCPNKLIVNKHLDLNLAGVWLLAICLCLHLPFWQSLMRDSYKELRICIPTVAFFEIREHLFISVLAVPKTRLIIVLALGTSYSLQSSLTETSAPLSQKMSQLFIP